MMKKITLADWQFLVDEEQTQLHSRNCSLDHCTCAYCRNFYEAVDRAQPRLRPVLNRFGIDINGPSEVMPFEPTLVSACYRVKGQILQAGASRLYVEDVPLLPEPADGESFFLWVGEMELPWLQSEPMEDVVSPANEPEFMQRMLTRWLQTRDDGDLSQ